MPLKTLAAVALLTALFTRCVPSEGAEGPGQGSTREKSRAALDAWLERTPDLPKTETEGRKLLPADDDVVRRVFPGQWFCGVHYYVDYPHPKPIRGAVRAHNLLHVRPDGVVERVGDVDALKALFKKYVPRARDEPQAKDAAAACLRVAEEFFQDGLYTFEAPEVDVTRHGDELVAKGQARVKSRGTGAISITLTFKPSGEVGEVETTGRVRPDVRRR
ncbi:MAG: hypothetical protein LC745_05860 [Planctomycetia bacterium]|nr:hypothetical protein [Planctomycetia bacterium]